MMASSTTPATPEPWDQLVAALNRLEAWESDDLDDIRKMIDMLRAQNKRIWRLVNSLEGAWFDHLYDLDVMIAQAEDVSWPALVNAGVLRVNGRQLKAWLDENQRREKGDA